MSEGTQQVHFTIDGDFINDQIQLAITEGRYESAYKMANSCLMSDDISDLERVGLTFAILSGAKRITNSEQEGCVALEDSDDSINVNDYAIKTIVNMSKQIEDKDESITLLNRKLMCIWDANFESNPQALRKACIEWVRLPYSKDGYLFNGDTTIPEELVDSFNENCAPWYEDEEHAGSLDDNRESAGSFFASLYGKNDPVAQFIEMQKKSTDDAMKAYGWLDPEGEFHNSDFGNHEKWAREYLEEQNDGFEEKSGFKIYESGDELIRRGWVLLHNPMRGIAKCTMNKNKKLTLAQKDFLYDYYDSWDRPEAVDAIKRGWMDEMPEFFDIIDVEDVNGRG